MRNVRAQARAPVSRVLAGIGYGLRLLFRPARGAVAVERRRARRLRWLVAVFALFGAVAVAMFFVDTRAIRFAAGLPEWLTGFFRAYTHLGLYEVILLPLAVVLLLCALAGARSLVPMQQRLLAAIAVRIEFLFLAVALPGIASGIVKRVIGRARPLADGDIFTYRPFDWTDAYASLPSGHTTAAFAVLVAFGSLWPRLLPLLLLYAAGIGVSRIIGSFHHVSDVIAGAFAGTAGAFLVREYFAARGLAFTRMSDGHIAPKPGPSRRRVAALLRKITGG